jgi:large subunit ribosomal protein L34
MPEVSFNFVSRKSDRTDATTRTFTTIRRLAVPRTGPASITQSPTLSLTRSFSGLSVRTSTTTPLSTTSSLLSRSTLQPLIPMIARSTSLSASSRTFSTSAALLGYRRRMDTYNPSRRVQKRRHGYLARLRTRGGQAILKRRKLKLRSNVSY